LLDGDCGPNTGGMGAYSPAPVVTPAVHARVMREVIDPAIAGMRADGVPYAGFLYAGLMIGRGGQLKVLEFNCRMGDPETEPILLRLKTDLVTLIEHAIDGSLESAEAEWDPRVALGVVLAAEGYPESPRTGVEIEGLPGLAGDDYHVFHAGTTRDGNRVVASGGRVLCVTALGHNVRTAHKRAYEIVSGIRFDGMQYRRDIGHRAFDARVKRAAVPPSTSK
jgi:phosphoribosylamine--glycine ligase